MNLQPESPVNAIPHQPVRVMTRSDLKQVEEFLQAVDNLISDSPVWIDYAEITISAAGDHGAEDELGMVIIRTDDQENTHVHFKPYGG